MFGSRYGGNRVGGYVDRCVSLLGGGYSCWQLFVLFGVVWRQGGVGWVREKEYRLGCQSKQGGFLVLFFSKYQLIVEGGVEWERFRFKVFGVGKGELDFRMCVWIRGVGVFRCLNVQGFTFLGERFLVGSYGVLFLFSLRFKMLGWKELQIVKQYFFFFIVVGLSLVEVWELVWTSF